jgi:predicted GH43/DUF377 family glycosyl hydrolase
MRKILLNPREVTRSWQNREVVGTLNPGAAEYDGKIYLVVRVAEKPLLRMPGFVALPRVDRSKGYTVDWVAETDCQPLDERGVSLRESGRHRFRTISHLRVAVSDDGVSLSRVQDDPLLFPEEEWEEYGVEDARITKIGDTYYMTYVAVSRWGIATALATTKDFQVIIRHGIIFPPENKNVVLFPEKTHGEFLALHRPNIKTPVGSPSMWLSRSPDCVHWGEHQALVLPAEAGGYNRLGAGAPPVRVKDGWLVVHHAVRTSAGRRGPGTYVANVMLLDPEDPSKVVKYGRRPLIVPPPGTNCEGPLASVVFPTGCILRERQCYIYCGERDTVTSVYKMPVGAVLETLK